MLREVLFASALAFACSARGAEAQTQVYRLLYSPTGFIQGAGPTTIFEVEPGLFYVLSAAETNTFGSSIFTITGAGKFNIVYTSQPTEAIFTLVQGTNGKLYGPGFLYQSNYSFYFSVAPSGKNLQEYPAPGQWGSAGEMIAVPAREFYDILASNPLQGRIYAFARLSNSGKITLLHQFSGSDGEPTGLNLVYGPDGNIYGIGNQLAMPYTGFIFRFTLAGAYSQLLSFPSFPAQGPPALLAASDGNLYGLFQAGGTNNTGELFQATLSGQLQTVASFPAKPGMAEPMGTIMQASDGNIYGGTNNYYIFRYNLKTHELSSAYHMNSSGSQGHCPCQIVQGMDGKLYGVTPSGGYVGGGVVFSLDLGLPKPRPVISKLDPVSGPVGQQVLLWGQYLLGATSVSFTGAAATNVKVTSVQSVWATVPPDATSGPVTITTANGSFTTTQNFTVQ